MTILAAGASKYATIPLQVISRLKQLAGEQKRSGYSSRSCKALNA